MLVKAVERVELVMAEVAFVVAAIPGAFRGRVDWVAVPLQELVGEGAVGVALAEGCEDGVTVDVASFGAGAGLEVVGDAAGGDEGCPAEGAFDVRAAVKARVAVLDNTLAAPLKLRRFRILADSC